MDQVSEPLERAVAEPATSVGRLRAVVRGAVQGVGFRPFVWRLARALGLTGWVGNSPNGVVLEVVGPAIALDAFLARLVSEAPPLAVIQGVEHTLLDPVAFGAFEIRDSDLGGVATAVVLPDVATCDACRREIFDPGARRYRYPFTNCTCCGPRYTIIEGLPYDRVRTTMRGFHMCGACREEYDDPRDRRFHAQPIACPACGPRLALTGADGRATARDDDALLAAAQAIRDGRIVAMRSLGGFHLVANARDDAAVRRLRVRKGRDAKPFALLYPSLDVVRAHATVSPLEELLLASPQAPIVLLARRDDVATPVASSVAPGNPWLGIMLPSNPLQLLLMAELGSPVVATSGNRSEEPICTDNDEARALLGGVADLFLVHDRPIARPVDDSIVRVIAGRATVLRRARGYAPMPIPLGRPVGGAVAVGAHLKGTVAVGVRDDAVVSQHLGDLDSATGYDRFAQTVRDLTTMYGVTPLRVACDAHPDYPSSRFAARLAGPPLRVQHHHAHVLACMADNALDPPVLGVAWDGTGYGLDGTVWGGEFLRVTADGFTRADHLRTFRLPGGDRAVVEPRRAALGLLYELYGESIPAGLAPMRAFAPDDLRVTLAMLRGRVNSPVTSSAGRLFDAVASLLDLRHRSTFEGQAAMDLEFAAYGHDTHEAYDAASTDWESLVRGVVADLGRGVAAGCIAAKFHNTLVEMIVAVALREREERIVLTGGCFQNRHLTERAVRRLRDAGLRPYWHQRVPPNDGGIAVGQLAALAALR